LDADQGSKLEADQPIDKYGKPDGGCIDLEMAENAGYELGRAPCDDYIAMQYTP
jgi:hypothetical protein